MFRSLATILLLTGLGSASSGVIAAAPAEGAAGDPRQAVEMPEQMRAHMLANMRDHLQAVGEIQQALAEARFTEAGAIAEERLGMSSLDDHGAKHMARFMPERMREIGTEMHRRASGFATVARDAEIDGDLRAPLEALAGVTRQCVACHAGFRATIKQP